MANATRFIITWSCYFAAYVAMTLGVGATLGGIFYPILAAFTKPELSLGSAMADGVWLGFKYGAVWAGGIAIVLCVMQGYRTKCGCPKRS
jgi:hypothetical protein